LKVDLDDYNCNEIITEFDAIKNMAKELLPGAKLSLLGDVPEFVELNSLVSKGQIISFSIALFVVAILMATVFGSIKIGLIAMIPNITPPIIIGGIMGLFNIPLTMMTMTVMPMLLGLAVDDTIHFITHARFEHHGERGRSYETAILKTLKTVGRSLFMTSFILIISFAIYLTSIVNIYFYLGVFIIAGVLSALIADFLMVPILIKWTKCFGKEQ
jgi:predicted RND superfamily exporter protein